MTIHSEHDTHRHDTPREASDGREPQRQKPASGAGIALPVAALAALTAAVLWFGLSPAPPARPAALARSGQELSQAASQAVDSPRANGATGVARPGDSAKVGVDPLPSWNDQPVKRNILDFVEKVTREGSGTFVPVPERVAVFDHDGTLVCEKPIVHGMFLIDRVRSLAEQQPELAHEEPFATLLTGDIDFVRRLGKKYFLDLTFNAFAGVPEEKLEADARDFMTTARHPVFDVPYGDVTFQPMKELIALLRSRDFSVWICSGSGIHFMRPAAEAWYGIGPEHVIASRPVSELREIDDAGDGDDANAAAATRRLELVVTPHLQVLNDEERKPVSIGEHIGRRPIFAAGNVGTTGDIEMLRWSQTSRHPSLQLLVLHDDADREMAYGEASNDSLEAADKYGWNVVRMATDWNRIFARPLEKKAATVPNPETSATAAPAAADAAAVAAPQTASPAVPRWEKEIAAIEAADREQPPAPGGVVFLGSSNIRLWTTMSEDFDGMNPLNRGVGGSQLSELALVASRLVTAAKPAAVVVSAGGNDIAAGATPAEVRDAFAKLVTQLRPELPEARIVFLAINPSIERWGQRDRQDEANALVREFIASQGPDAGLAYIDANAALLGADGTPAVECFLDDQLHPSTIGNARRAAIIRPLLHDLLP